VLLALTGCATKWEVQKAPAADVIKFSDGDAYLVTRASGTQVELREARVEHDSVIGVKKDEATGPAENARLAIASPTSGRSRSGSPTAWRRPSGFP